MRHKMSTVMTAALVSALLAAAASDKGAADWKVPIREAKRKNPVAADSGSISHGKAVFLKNCAQCHGRSGKGNGPKGMDLLPKPPDLSSAEVQSQSEGSLQWKIATGRRPMPAFGKILSEPDRWHAVNYIRSLRAVARPAGN